MSTIALPMVTTSMGVSGTGRDPNPGPTSLGNVTHEYDPYRLPRTVVPSRYELTIEPDLETATFAGFESVAVDVHETVDEIVLNALELEIDEAWLEGADGGPHRRDRHRSTRTPSGPTSRWRPPAAPGAYTLHARFRGVLNDKLIGFYRTTFTDDDGTEQVIATTQFEATDARRAFPCWDEPDLKAVFAHHARRRRRADRAVQRRRAAARAGDRRQDAGSRSPTR